MPIRTDICEPLTESVIARSESKPVTPCVTLSRASRDSWLLASDAAIFAACGRAIECLHSDQPVPELLSGAEEDCFVVPPRNDDLPPAIEQT